MTAILLVLLAMVTPSFGVELATSAGDTVHLYEVAYPSSAVDRLEMYGFPMEVREGGVPIPPRVSSDETDIALLSHMARAVVVYSVTHELAREVDPDSVSSERRLGVRQITLDLGLIYDRSTFFDRIQTSTCPKEVAAEDTLLTGPYRGQPRCASYLPMPSFSGTATEALFDSVYTAQKTRIEAYADSMENNDSREEAEKATREGALLAR